MFDYFQAILELNLGISPFIQKEVGRKSGDELKEIILKEFQGYWESEYPRLGEISQSSLEISGPGVILSRCFSSMSAGCGYMKWISFGKPLDGWSSGFGITGNYCEEGGVSNNNAPELTGDQLFEEVLRLEKQLLPLCGKDERTIPDVEVQRRTESNNVEILKSSLNPSQRRRAVEFFEYHDTEEKVLDDPDSLSSAPPEIDAGLIYSRVHGYRIKIDHHEDTSLAYKKVLGDIKV